MKKELGFVNKFNIEDAINDLKTAFINKRYQKTLDNKLYFNLKMMSSVNLK